MYNPKTLKKNEPSVARAKLLEGNDESFEHNETTNDTIQVKD